MTEESEGMRKGRSRSSLLGRMVAGLSAVAIIGSFALGAVPAGASTGTATINATGTTGNNLIIGSGSSTTYSMMQQLDTLYNGANQCTMTIDRTGATAVQPLDFSCLTQAQETNGGVLNPVNPSTATTPNPFGDIAVEEPPIGSSNGILQLESAQGSATAYNLKYGSANGTVNAFNGVNFARSSRSASISSSGDNQGLNFVAYAKDGVDWSHFTSTAAGANCSAAVGRLTTSELKAIWQGQIWNWSQVGGCNAPIIVFSAQEGSGTQSTWKTTLGTDPSAVQSSTFYANCWNNGNTTASGNEGLSLATLQTNEPTNAKCNGPIDIFENETAQLNVNALPAQMINPNSTATGGLNAGAHVSGTAGSLTAVYTLPGSSKPLACNQWWLGCTSSGTGNSTVWTFALPNAASVLARSIFFYSAGIFHHQCINSGGANTVTTCNANSWKVLSIDPTGATTMALGSIGTFPGSTTLQTTGLTSAGEPATTCATVAGNPSPCQPTEMSILTGSFTSVRSLYNVYVNGQSNATAHMNEATAATLNYIGETGFLCTPRTASITDPNTGVNYLTEIQNTILGAGFYPITAGAASGTVNQTPVTSEGSVGTLGAESMYPTGPYAPYLAHAGGSAAAPSGFCNFTTTSGASGQPVAG